MNRCSRGRSSVFRAIPRERAEYNLAAQILTRLSPMRVVAIAAGARAACANKTSPVAVARLMPLSHFDAQEVGRVVKGDASA